MKVWSQSYESILQERILLVVSKSKKIMEVLSFVRNVLASFNKEFAIFSAEISSSVELLSFVCTS